VRLLPWLTSRSKHRADTDKESRQTLSVPSAGGRDTGAYVARHGHYLPSREIDPGTAAQYRNRQSTALQVSRLSNPCFSHRGRFGRDGRRVGRGQQEQVVALRSIDKSVIDWKCSPEATLFNRESFSQEAPGGVPPGAAWSAWQGTMPVTSVLFTPLSITQRMSCHCPIIFVY
jgi:hypothetical protein